MHVFLYGYLKIDLNTLSFGKLLRGN